VQHPAVGPVAAVWLPLAADLTPANVGDNTHALTLLSEVPPNVRFVLGDRHYHDRKLEQLCAARGQPLVTTKKRRYPHRDPGVEVRRIFHQLRSPALETFNSQFKSIFGCLGQVPTRGLLPTRRYVLGAVFVYQLALIHRFESRGDLRVGLKPFLQAA
jgi:hypothetical protein